MSESTNGSTLSVGGDWVTTRLRRRGSNCDCFQKSLTTTVVVVVVVVVVAVAAAAAATDAAEYHHNNDYFCWGTDLIGTPRIILRKLLVRCTVRRWCESRTAESYRHLPITRPANRKGATSEPECILG